MMRRLIAVTALIALSGLIVQYSGTSRAASVAAGSPAATQPTDESAATRPSSKFPTPAELIARMKARRLQEQEMPKVAYFDLSEPISEKPADFSIFANVDSGLTLRVLIDRLEQARQDKKIRAVLITLGDAELNL